MTTKQTSDASALGFGGGKPVANRTLRKFRARRRCLPGFPWQGQFQTEDEVRRYFSGDRINCLLCGRSFRRVSVHVQKIHGINEDAYRVRFGLPRSRGLVSEACHEAYAQHSSNPEQLERFAKFRLLTKKTGPRRRTPLVYYNPIDNLSGKIGFKIWNGEATRMEFLKRIGNGRTMSEVCQDADMPPKSWIQTQMRAHPDFRIVFEAVWETLPFDVQARAQWLGKRFDVALRELFDQGLSDKKAAKILGVTAMACNRRTKPWRHGLATRLQEA